jgi:hypothetical protein
MSLDAMKDIDPRIQIRLADSRLCEYYTITAPAYRHAESRKEARKQKPKRTKGR